MVKVGSDTHVCTIFKIYMRMFSVHDLSPLRILQTFQSGHMSDMDFEWNPPCFKLALSWVKPTSVTIVGCGPIHGSWPECVSPAREQICSSAQSAGMITEP